MKSLHTIGFHDVHAPAYRPEGPRELAATRDRDCLAVRVLSVEIETGEPSIPAGHRRVRAIVHLGRLTPADVHVQATLARARPDDMPREVHAARLWSAQSYHNGVYVFEAHVAEPMLDDPERLTVLVEPRPRPD